MQPKPFLEKGHLHCIIRIMYDAFSHVDVRSWACVARWRLMCGVIGRCECGHNGTIVNTTMVTQLGYMVITQIEIAYTIDCMYVDSAA